MSSENLPVLGLTLGDPNGVGPEVVLRALAEPPESGTWRPLIFGDWEVVRQVNQWLGEPVALRRCPPDLQALPEQAEGVPVLDLAVQEARQWSLGTCCAWGGESAFRFVHEAIRWAQERRIAALVTAPLAKEALQAAGHRFPGHTEMLSHYTNGAHSVMMLAVDNLRATMVTLHMSLRGVLETLTPELILDVIQITDQALRQMQIPSPRLVVPGLNPHAGENGLFGSEEQEIIVPALEQARQMGIEVTGPLPPDTVFLRHQKGEFDAVVALYHDQALIPLKLIGFDRAVNVTLGLPILRTSVDHGTAFDIAPRLQADPGSMVAAIRMALQLASGAQSPPAVAEALVD